MGSYTTFRLKDVPWVDAPPAGSARRKVIIQVIVQVFLLVLVSLALPFAHGALHEIHGHQAENKLSSQPHVSHKYLLDVQPGRAK